MAHGQNKQTQKSKPKENKQVMDGLNLSFEDAMKLLSQPMEDQRDLQFEEALNTIELKYLDYFKQRPSMRRGEDYLPIGDYIFTNDNVMGIGTMYKLPIEIHNEIMNVIAEFYPPPN